jgi:flagellar basal body rod protein FlgG
MYDAVISKVDTLYGMDTDSAFISKDDFNKLDKDMIGTEFGQFKVEHKNFDAILIAPKCYVFHRKEKIIKARFKGVSIEKDKLYSTEKNAKREKIPAIDLYNLYHSDKLKVTGLNIYEALYENKYAEVICNNISKRLIQNNNAIYLSNHTFIKEIKVEDNEVTIDF